MSEKNELYTQLLEDLKAEHNYILDVLKSLKDFEFDVPSMAEGWSIKDQISHLAYFDDVASFAARNKEAFEEIKKKLSELDDPMEEHLMIARSSDGRYLTDWFESAFWTLVQTYSKLDPSSEVPWFGPPMSAMSMLTARLMENWAHGYDILTALQKEPSRTDRLVHICYLGYRTISWSFIVNGLDPPKEDFYISVILPSKKQVTFGNQDAPNKIYGDAYELALVVTQRKNVNETSIQASGPSAQKWLSIAQAFAGAPKKPSQN